MSIRLQVDLASWVWPPGPLSTSGFNLKLSCENKLRQDTAKCRVNCLGTAQNFICHIFVNTQILVHVFRTVVMKRDIWYCCIFAVILPFRVNFARFYCVFCWYDVCWALNSLSKFASILLVNCLHVSTNVYCVLLCTLHLLSAHILLLMIGKGTFTWYN